MSFFDEEPSLLRKKPPSDPWWAEVLLSSGAYLIALVRSLPEAAVLAGAVAMADGPSWAWVAAGGTVLFINADRYAARLSERG